MATCLHVITVPRNVSAKGPPASPWRAISCGLVARHNASTSAARLVNRSAALQHGACASCWCHRREGQHGLRCQKFAQVCQI